MSKDNTFRALQDKEPIPERPWQCKFKLHRWLKWSEIEKKGGNLYAYQKRYCADCNQAQTRKLNWDY